MQIIKAGIAALVTESRSKSHELTSRQANNKNNRRRSHELLKTSALTGLSTIVGTAALVSIHHHYRKQRQPGASLQDYATGIRSHLPSASKTQLTRFRYACQQSTAAWQHAYHSPIDGRKNTNHNSVTDFSVVHTTSMLARPVCWVSGVASMPKNIASTNTGNSSDDCNNELGFGVVGIDADREIVWQTTMPERVHDIVVQPVSDTQDKFISNKQSRDVVVMGRRPSEKFWVLDTATGKVKSAIKASDNRHFYGHACYSLDGKLLYVTENDTISLDGKIGIYEAYDSYKKVAEYDSYGIGPHELIMHPDGETLVIANGGIKTEQASREELNLDTMHPSLVYLNRRDGSLLEQIFPEHNQMSIRHLAVHDNGTVMIGIQFQGEKHINVPLVLTHKRGNSDFKPLIMPNNQWQRFHQYIASVAVDSKRHLLCVTTPIGGCAAIYDLNTRKLIDDVNLPDCAGASVFFNQSASNTNDNGGKSGFIVSDGQGQLTTLEINYLSVTEPVNVNNIEKVKRVIKNSKLHRMSFDNHLQAL